ncbi:unnamed protein product, partial [Adineta steineri]
MSTNNTYAATLLAATSYVTLSIDLITLIIGIVGCICNLITFTAPQLRGNACIFYLLCATVFQMVSILFIIPNRLAANNFGSNFDPHSIIYCKIHYYLVITLPESATFHILLSIMDRCLATSTTARIRAWSDLKIAHRISAGIIIIIVLQVVVSATLESLRLGSYAYSIFTSGNLTKTLTARVIENFTVQFGVSIYFLSL